MRVRTAVAVWLLAVWFVAAVAVPQEKQPPKPAAENLISTMAFPAKWEYFSSEKTSKMDDTWKLDATTDTNLAVLICKGKPSGYLRTKAEYDNFEMTLDWKYPADPNCNSGILIHCGADKIWPASIQVQLHRPFVGSIFPLPGAETTNRVTVKDLKLDTAKWHTCVITSKDGTISLTINGKKVGEVNGCKPAKGFIALQSEGSEIHFRKMEIRDLNPAKKVPPSTAPADKKSAPKSDPKPIAPAGKSAS